MGYFIIIIIMRVIQMMVGILWVQQLVKSVILDTEEKVHAWGIVNYQELGMINLLSAIMVIEIVWNKICVFVDLIYFNFDCYHRLICIVFFWFSLFCELCLIIFVFQRDNLIFILQVNIKIKI